MYQLHRSPRGLEACQCHARRRLTRVAIADCVDRKRHLVDQDLEDPTVQGSTVMYRPTVQPNAPCVDDHAMAPEGLEPYGCLR